MIWPLPMHDDGVTNNGINYDVCTNFEHFLKKISSDYANICWIRYRIRKVFL